MKFVCDDCGTQYLISDEKVGPKGVKIRCKRCGNIIIVHAQNHQQEDPKAEDRADIDGQATDVAGSFLKDDEPGLDPEGDSTGDQDELGQAFDQLLNNGLNDPDDEDDGEVGQSTEIFSMEELAQLRNQKKQGEKEKIDQVFAEAEGTAIPQQSEAEDGSQREEWYVAIKDEQIGPMDLQEMENRWSSGQISANSLAWHPGMDDWKMVKDVPKLRYLLGTENKDGELPTAVAPSPLNSERAFSDEGWDTSAGSALSSLVEEEIQAVKSIPEKEDNEPDRARDDDSEQPASESSEEMAPWEKEEVLSGEVARPSENFFDSTHDAPLDSDSSPSAGRFALNYSKPAYLSSGPGAKFSRKLILAISAALLSVAVLIVLVFVPGLFSDDSGKQEGTSLPVGENKQVQVVEDTKKLPKDTAKTEELAKKSKPSAPAVSKSTPKKEAADEIVVKKAGATTLKKNTASADKSSKKSRSVLTKTAKKDSKVAAKTKSTKKSSRKDRRVAAAKAAPRKEPADGTLPATLSKGKIREVMGKYIGVMRACVSQQKQRDPSVSGTMLVSFVIMGSGGTSKVRILSKEHGGTYVASCISHLVKNMKFPKFSGKPIPVPKLPLKLGG